MPSIPRVGRGVEVVGDVPRNEESAPWLWFTFSYGASWTDYFPVLSEAHLDDFVVVAEKIRNGTSSTSSLEYCGILDFHCPHVVRNVIEQLPPVRRFR